MSAVWGHLSAAAYANSVLAFSWSFMDTLGLMLDVDSSLFCILPAKIDDSKRDDVARRWKSGVRCGGPKFLLNHLVPKTVPSPDAGGEGTDF